MEQSDRAIDALLSAPVDREAIYLGKAAANLLFVVSVQFIALPATALLYNLSPGDVIGPLAAISLLLAIGIVAIGTLFSSMAVNTRLAELLLPMLSLPFFVPLVMAAAGSTSRLLAGRPLAEAWPWLRILIGFDVVFLVASALLFPFTIQE